MLHSCVYFPIVSTISSVQVGSSQNFYSKIHSTGYDYQLYIQLKATHQFHLRKFLAPTNMSHSQCDKTVEDLLRYYNTVTVCRDGNQLLNALCFGQCLSIQYLYDIILRFSDQKVSMFSFCLNEKFAPFRTIKQQIFAS